MTLPSGKDMKCVKEESQETTFVDIKDEVFQRENLRAHDNERPYQCTECEKGFKTQKDLKCHLMIHKEYKPFQCTDCGTSFRQLAHLNTHVSIHKEAKPFQCNICNKSFRLLAFTKKHMRRHKQKHITDKVNKSSTGVEGSKPTNVTIKHTEMATINEIFREETNNFNPNEHSWTNSNDDTLRAQRRTKKTHIVKLKHSIQKSIQSIKECFCAPCVKRASNSIGT